MLSAALLNFPGSVPLSLNSSVAELELDRKDIGHMSECNIESLELAVSAIIKFAFKIFVKGPVTFFFSIVYNLLKYLAAEAFHRTTGG